MTRHDPERAAKVLAVIEDYTAEYGFAPSVREIAERVGLASTSAVHHWLIRLEKEGRLARSADVARSLRVVRQAPGEGICARPGCGKPAITRRRGSERRWCSRSCQAIAAHLRRWLRATGTDYLAEQLGLTA